MIDYFKKYTKVLLLGVVFSIAFQLSNISITKAVPIGSGTPEDPYQIIDCAGLQDIDSSPSAHFLVTTDIDCSGFGNFSPITIFSGTLDGNNYTITGVTIVNDIGNGNIGLFGHVVGGTIENLTFRDFSLTDNNSAAYIGAIAGLFDDGTLNHVRFINLTVNASGAAYVGGVIGIATNINMSEVEVSGTSSVIADVYVGALIGILSSDDVINYSQIQNCSSNASVTAGSYISGFIGNADSPFGAEVGFIKNSYSTGDVIGDVYVGQFLGTDSGEMPVENNFATGAVSGNSYTGFIGANGFKDYSSNYSTDYCSGCNSSVPASTWHNTISAAPLDQWDFSTVWVKQVGTFPKLRFGPDLAEVTPVTASSNDSTPSYTFSSTRAGTITYSGSCSSVTTSAVLGNNTISFNSLADGTYSNCKIEVTDINNDVSEMLSVTSFTIDTTVPTATITYNPVGGVYKSGAIVTITATFNEAMANSPVTKIALSGTSTLAATNMTKVDSTHYTYDYTVGAGNGTTTVTLSVGTDIAGNIIAAGSSFQVDNTAPTGEFISPTVASQGETHSTSLPFALTFTEDVNGLTADDIIVTNGTLNNFTVATINTQFSFNIVPSGSGAVTVNIAAGEVQDDAGNNNIAAPEYNFTYFLLVTLGGGGGSGGGSAAFGHSASSGGGGSSGGSVLSPTLNSSSQTVEATSASKSEVSSESTKPFTDIDGHWAYNFIMQLYNLKVVQGRAPGLFVPEGDLTRAEAVKMGIVTFGYPLDADNFKSGYSDLDTQAWYISYIRKAKKEGFISGTKFRPNEPITRIDALVMYFKMAKKFDKSPKSPFKDINQSASYAPYVNYAYAQGVVEGRGEKGTQFQPFSTITRAEISKIIIKIREL